MLIFGINYNVDIKLSFSSIRIWDYTQDACINILSGHTAPVRGLTWNTEIPYLLISGSWDYTIKVWDTRDGVCLDTVYDHGADVYGNFFPCISHFVVIMMLIFEQCSIFK